MWIVFLADYDFSPPERNGRVTIAYKPGLRFVRKICGIAAIAKGRARPATETEKDEGRKSLSRIRF